MNGWAVARSIILVGAVGFIGSACSPVTAPSKDDAAPTPQDDAAVNPADAGDTTPDARPPTQAPPSTDITNSGAHIQGSTYSMDVQIGHPFDQGKSSGGGKTTEGGAAIKP